MNIAQSEISKALPRIAAHIHRTPVLTSRLINTIAGAELFFKCDNFQKGGSYKIRGAANAILQLSEEDRTQGVVTHSSGNFAQALSLAAQAIGIKAYIVMPSNAPEVKKAAVREYGGKIIECQPTLPAREETAQQVIAETGATFIHPSNDLHVILGQSTISRELLEEQPELDCMVTPIGGGGVGAGTCLTAKHSPRQIQVYGAEPSGADDAFRSLHAGRIIPSVDPETICDGLRTSLGDKNFPIIQAGISEIILVEDQETIAAMRLILERMKIVVEPSSAITLAAILKRPDFFSGKKIGLIITGGNVDLTKFGQYFVG